MFRLPLLPPPLLAGCVAPPPYRMDQLPYDVAPRPNRLPPSPYATTPTPAVIATPLPPPRAYPPGAYPGADPGEPTQLEPPPAPPPGTLTIIGPSDLPPASPAPPPSHRPNPARPHRTPPTLPAGMPSSSSCSNPCPTPPMPRPRAPPASRGPRPSLQQRRADAGLPPNARPEARHRPVRPAMPRILTAAAAQLGPIQRAEGRDVAVARMIRLMERAQARGVQLVVFPGAGAHHLLPPPLPRRSRRGRPLVRNRDALERHRPALRGRKAHRHRLPPGLCRDRRGAGRARHPPPPPLQHRHPGGPHRRDPAEIPQDPSPRPRRLPPPAQGPAPRKALLRSRQPRLPRHPRPHGRARHQHGPADLQRPALARGLARAGPAIVELVMLGYNTPSINQNAAGFEAHHLRVFHSHLSIQSAPIRTAASPLPRPKPAPKTTANCSATASSSTPRARSWPKPQPGTTS